MSIILKAENISKQYRLGTVGTGTISHDLNRWWHQIRGKEDPYLKVGAVNDRSAKASEDYVWALRDINFEVKTGEVLGIIGKNGAGKSTLLKLLSRITSPTTGSIRTKGRIASLLEVGTGFHPELTGRENIYLNGAILGMTKPEIKSKIDEIIAFSGCEMYIDTPVKRYSSGMRVRLGFAVAAHLEPEILVVDEVLAVGDAEFQKKAIGKMQDLSTGEGRTVLFVSHNMGSIKSLCTRAIVLENGSVKYNGGVSKAISKYLEVNGNNKNGVLLNTKSRSGNGNIKIDKIELYSKNQLIREPVSGEPLQILFYYTAREKYENIIFGIAVKDHQGIKVTAINNDEHKKLLEIEKGQGVVELQFERLQLYGGIYYLDMILSQNQTGRDNHMDFIEDALKLNVLPGDFWNAGKINRKRNTPIIEGKFKLLNQ